ncbi:type II toxin-antitoxin system RelE/ParE family toxin [Nitrosovibrio sp. Nv17]|uniref:type II toxin-antitoxin system RelE/ParE family toxin n=1 Tax=Nitrosovibrio sp. Nv17 TaxID=1855339 RepID=UPI00090886D7|nr:type II toxin-antitoxin system RelE/ParE family toxin [Nitrosovibrio sp. Nv17]SFW15667.1 Plasmid stabilization system protein ParE [Nitrosovibrio sp. Nv17]
MRVRLSRWAETDLIEITDFIALDNPKRASEFEDELLEHAHKIAHAPLGYVERPELKKGIRSCAHGAYVIFFKGVRIERILHGARDLGPLLNQ